MHIPAHVLDPVTCAATGAISTAAVGYALYRVRRESIGAKLPLVALTGASLLAAQAINYPIGAGTSGHFLGGCLAAILLGPWASLLVMAAVVAVQCLVFHDGGVDALGANILNMAVVGTWVGHAIYARAKTSLAGGFGVIVAGMVAAWACVMASAAICSIELSLGAGYPIVPTLNAMLSVHILITIGEGVVTLAVLAALPQDAMAKCTWRTALIGLTCAVIAAAALTPVASQLPDGLETCLAQIADHVRL